MIFLPHRPQVRLRMYPEVLPGETFDATLLLDALREVQVDFVEVSFNGSELRLFSNQPSSRLKLVSLSARVSGPRRLRPGRTELPFKVPVPPDLPPSYEGRTVRTRYELAVHVSVPWWPDRYEHFVVRIARPEPDAKEPLAVVPGRFATDRRGPRGTQPYMEGSVTTTNIEPGSVLSGAVALSNTAVNRYRRLTVSLVARESDPRNSSVAAVETKRYELELPLESLREAEPIPFHLAVPATLHPTCRSRLWELRWFVEVRAELGWRPDLRFDVPVKVFPERGARPALGPQIRVPPSIGSPRIEAIWRRVADEAGLTFTEEGLEGVLQGVRLLVRRDPRGRRGQFVVGELRYPSLGIGLRVRSLRGLERHWGSPSLSFGDAAWDRKNQVEGRDVAQVLVFGRHVVDALWAFSGVNIDDESMLVERRGTGHDRRVLQQFVNNVKQLCRAVAAAREAIPAPAEMELALPRWEELAGRLHGSLNRANMSVVGSLRGMTIAVLTDWTDTGSARYTRVELAFAMPVSGRYAISVGAPGGSPDLTSYPDEARELVTMLIEGAEGFSVTTDRLILLLPAPLLEPVPFVTERLEWMVQLYQALGHGGGPYR